MVNSGGGSRWQSHLLFVDDPGDQERSPRQRHPHEEKERLSRGERRVGKRKHAKVLTHAVHGRKDRPAAGSADLYKRMVKGVRAERAIFTLISILGQALETDRKERNVLSYKQPRLLQCRSRLEADTRKTESDQ
jgi:hypothetical protein